MRGCVKTLTLLVLGIVLAGTLPAGAALSEDQAAARGLQEPDTVTRAAVWEDFDRDGDLDVAFGNLFYPNRIYRNEGDGSFTDVSEDWGIDQALVEHTYGVIVADYDNDGDGDLYFTNGGFNGLGVNRLYRNELLTLGRFYETSLVAGVQGEPSYNFAAAWIDFDRDGWLDLFVHRGDAASILYRNRGDGRFEAIDIPGVTDLINEGANGACVLDYDDDGDQDLLVPAYHPNLGVSGMALLRNDWPDGAQNMTQGSGLGSLPRSFTCAVDDFNQDGRLDVYVATFNLASDPVKVASALWVNDGGGLFSLVPGAHEIAGNTMGLQTGDLDADGFPDMFIGQGDPEVTSADTLLRNVTARGGPVAFQDVTAAALPAVASTRTHGTNFVDVDGDNRMDIFVGNGGNMPTACTGDPCALPGQEEPNRLFVRTDGGAGNWLRYRLVGMLSNRDAIGARLRLETDAGVFHRHVSGGNGFNTMNPLEALAGLGSASQVMRVWIRWPSGIYQKISAPALFQLHRWEETGIRATVLPAENSVQIEVVGPSDSAYEVWGSETLATGAQAGTRLLEEPLYHLASGNLDTDLPRRGFGSANLAVAKIRIPAELRDGRPLHFQARVLLPDGWYATNFATVSFD